MGERCWIDEPAVAGCIEIERNRRPKRERQVAIGQIGHRDRRTAQEVKLLRTQSGRIIDPIPIQR